MSNDFYAGLSFALTGIAPSSVSSTRTYPKYYGLQYVHSGKFYLSVDGGTMYELEGPVAFLTSPESVFSYGSPPGGSRNHYYVCFHGERTLRYVETGLFPLARNQKTPFYRIHSPEEFLADMVRLIFLVNAGNRHDTAVNQLEKILLSLSEQEAEPPDSGFYRKELDQLVLDILANPEKPWDFRKEAAKRNLSQKHFIRLFHNAFGMSPGRYVLKQRISKACLLLTMQNVPVKVVADECGFNSPFYFSRLFKKYMLMPPEAYRASHYGNSNSQVPGKS